MSEASLTYPSLTLRIGLGKLYGFAFGLIGFLILPILAPETAIMTQWAILLWYTTLGAIIGVFGVYTKHPVLDFPLPWWLRATIIGAWMNFVLTLFAYDTFMPLMKGMNNIGFGFISSPFWFAFEGAVAGLIIGGLLTKQAGEGRKTLD